MVRPPDQLNEREREILRRLSGGMTDRQIAGELFLSLNTVKWYNRQIYAKLGVANRFQAIAHARTTEHFEPRGLTPHPAADASDSAMSPQRSKANQRISFCRSRDGTRIALAIAGSGPPLVKVANYMSHLEHDWSSPVWMHWLEGLSTQHTLITFDERGSGLSDWDVKEISFESWVEDLEAVVDTVGLRRFPLFAMSQAGAVAVAYAARHPERVSRLVLLGAYARGWLNRDLTGEQVEEERLMIDLMRIGWGKENPAFRQVFATQLFPDASTEQLRALETQMRISVSPENAVRLESEMHRIDVRETASAVKAPTLIFHARRDEGVPFQEGRLLATLIPKAQFVALDSQNHILTANEPAWRDFLAVFREFLGGENG
jgi:pimeloyl-ACP methyl ester carboxylesterase/DNA-binding CsgD family transcriptional regulator